MLTVNRVKKKDSWLEEFFDILHDSPDINRSNNHIFTVSFSQVFLKRKPGFTLCDILKVFFTSYSFITSP